MVTDLALELRRLAALVETLADDVRHLERRRLTVDDRRTMTVLLPLAHELVGDERFTVPTLYSQALNDRGAVGQAAREVLSGYGSIRSIGKMFARTAGVVLGGHRLVRVGTRGDDALYVVESVSDD